MPIASHAGMHTAKTWLFLATALLSTLALAASWEMIRATDFLDTEVVNNDGEAVGEVRELVIDMRTGRVHYVVLEVGGVLGLGEKLIPYPVSALSPGPRDDRVVLDVRPETLADAAGFERDRWPAWNDPIWDRAERPHPDPEASAGGSAFDSQPQFLRTEELIGRKVQDRDGNAAGRLADLVLNLSSGEVRQALITGDRETLVPFSRLHRQAGAPGQPLVLEKDY
jgi:sporulation protein YlmC with PRC-barrel domain